MPYFTENDYLQYIKANNFQALQDGEPLALKNAEATAIDIAKTYLSLKYDTDTIFTTEGSSRNMHLLQMCIYIVLYQLYQRLPKRQVPSNVESDYALAIETLEKIADGKLNIQLPIKIVSNGDGESKTSTVFRYGSRKKRSNGYY